MPKKRDSFITVAIPSDEKAMLQAIADKADLSLSDAVIRAIRNLIESCPIKGEKANR
jgi:hypothetical protein